MLHFPKNSPTSMCPPFYLFPFIYMYLHPSPSNTLTPLTQTLHSPFINYDIIFMLLTLSLSGSAVLCFNVYIPFNMLYMFIYNIHLSCIQHMTFQHHDVHRSERSHRHTMKLCYSIIDLKTEHLFICLI